MMKTDACIGSPHWKACETCVHDLDDGCELTGGDPLEENTDLDLSLYLGDFILCGYYEKKKD